MRGSCLLLLGLGGCLLLAEGANGMGTAVYGAKSGQGPRPDFMMGLRLRGGSSVGKSGSNPSMRVQSFTGGAMPERSASGSMERHRFTYRSKPGAKTVQVVGGWSRFKERHDMQEAGANTGLWETSIMLPVGTHELKFVIDGSKWVCSDQMPKSSDNRGNENNVVTIRSTNSRPATPVPQQMQQPPQQSSSFSTPPPPRPPSPPPPPPPAPPPPQETESDVYVAHKDSIDSAASAVQQLEEAKRRAEEKLAKAHSQLVDTMVEELEAGLKQLEACKADVQGFASKGKAGAQEIQEAQQAKVTLIKNHAASLRAVLDRKEAASIKAVNEMSQGRLAALEQHMEGFAGAVPQLDSLIEQSRRCINDAKKKPDKFVSTAQPLILEMAQASERAGALQEPAVESGFENLQYEEDGTMVDLLR